MDIQNSNVTGGLSLAGNIILTAREAADNAGQALKYWDVAAILDDTKALRKRPQVEALLEGIRGQYVEYFPVDTPIMEAHKAIQAICAAVCVAYDCYNAAAGTGEKFAGSPELARFRLGVNYCDEMEAAILNASLTYACYRIGEAAYMAAGVERVALILTGKPIPETEREQLEKIRADALAALEPVRQRYGLIFPIAKDVEQANALTAKHEELGYILKKVWKSSGVEIL